VSCEPEARCILIGVGRRSLDDYVPAFAQLAPHIALVAACDVDPAAEARLAQEIDAHGGAPVPFFTDRAAALEQTTPDLAIVATPHHTHLDIAGDLIRRGIPFVKEKPFAISLPEAVELASLLRENDGFMRLCVQRRYHPLYAYARKALAGIGALRHFDAVYQLHADAYRVGWRAHSETSGGGAIIDMGYHMIDALHWFFGPPALVYATAAPKLIPSAPYDIEETVLATLSYGGGMTGALRLSLCEATKEERVRVYGADGRIELTRRLFQRYDAENRLVEELDGDGDWATAAVVLTDTVGRLSDPAIAAWEVADGLDVTATIDALYGSIVRQTPVRPTHQETFGVKDKARGQRRDPRAGEHHDVSLAETASRVV
jgi:predicted dehydrogenase